jgi:hypothetical protein
MIPLGQTLLRLGLGTLIDDERANFLSAAVAATASSKGIVGLQTGS